MATKEISLIDSDADTEMGDDGIACSRPRRSTTLKQRSRPVIESDTEEEEPAGEPDEQVEGAGDEVEIVTKRTRMLMVAVEGMNIFHALCDYLEFIQP